MSYEYFEKAYAKVNFNLKVYPKRSGHEYHDIESIFQTIDLYDELVVRENESGDCKVICDSLVLPENNTLTSAYRAFCELTKADCKVPGVDVYLKKGIPAGGGLGGGSSDAAALVRVLEKMCGIKLSDLQLDLVAQKTGSDVFFFMHCDEEGRGCALVSGRGEVVEKIPSRQDLYLLLVFPELSSSTKEAYALVDELLYKESVSGKKVIYPAFCELEAVYRQAPDCWAFKNTFTPALVTRYKVIADALEAIRETGSLYTDMSGSGSTVFGVFTLRQQAIYSSNLLAEKWNCTVAKTV